MSVCQSAILYIFCLSVCLPVCLSVCLSVCLPFFCPSYCGPNSLAMAVYTLKNFEVGRGGWNKKKLYSSIIDKGGHWWEQNIQTKTNWMSQKNVILFHKKSEEVSCLGVLYPNERFFFGLVDCFYETPNKRGSWESSYDKVQHRWISRSPSLAHGHVQLLHFRGSAD